MIEIPISHNMVSDPSCQYNVKTLIFISFYLCRILLLKSLNT